jgi:hypothetical protein
MRHRRLSTAEPVTRDSLAAVISHDTVCGRNLAVAGHLPSILVADLETSFLQSAFILESDLMPVTGLAVGSNLFNARL